MLLRCIIFHSFLQSSNRTSEETDENKPAGSSAEAKTAKCDEGSDVSYILSSEEPTSECTPTKAEPVKRTEIPAFPEPLVPYPCFSTLSVKNRNMYLNMLVRKNYLKASKVDNLLSWSSSFNSEAVLIELHGCKAVFMRFILSLVSKCLMEQVKNEVSEFMKYLQDVSRACADGYNYMPPGSSRYIEVLFIYFTIQMFTQNCCCLITFFII